jgi:hypothetical protein
LFKSRSLERITDRIDKLDSELAKERTSRLEAQEKFQEQVRELAGNVDRELDRLRSLTDEIDARIDRGNKIWRQIRARESFEEKRRDEEGWGELPEGDARGSDPQGVLPLHGNVEGITRFEPGWDEIKRAWNRRIAGLE